MLSFKINKISLSLSALLVAPGLFAADSYPLSQLVQISSDTQVEVSVKGPITRTHPLSANTISASKPQLNPLKTAITIEFQSQTVTVGAAASAVAISLGYELLDRGKNVSTQTKDLLASNLPLVHSTFTNLPADEILRSLSGPGFIPVVDHVSRLITFDPIPIFAKTGNYALQTFEASSILNDASWQNVSTEKDTANLESKPAFEDEQPKISAPIEEERLLPDPIVEDLPRLEHSVSTTTTHETLKKAPLKRTSVQSLATSDRFIKTKNVSAPDAPDAIDLAGYKAVKGSILKFRHRSIKMKSNYRSTLEDLERSFVPETDKIRLIGCAIPVRWKAVLAQKRAEKVSALLVKAGIPSSSIQVATCFEDDSIIIADPESVFIDLMRL